MVKLNYKINDFLKQIYVVIVPNNYSRAMLFLRTQEFYESKNKRFRSKGYSFWDYMEWYSSENRNSFTYAKDWSGFNFPLKVALECKKVSRVETPYDKEMNKIINFIQKSAEKNSYIIGVGSKDTEVFRHEISHALYYTNRDYKKKMNELTRSLDKNCLKRLKQELLDLGYCNKVLNDEIQAYISTGGGTMIKKSKIKSNTINEYKKVFNEEYKILKENVKSSL